MLTTGINLMNGRQASGKIGYALNVVVLLDRDIIQCKGDHTTNVNVIIVMIADRL